ncbi:MAG TPA: cupin domain-containing protein [Polyangia bacterium]|jgi:putative transcriptional regulator|nr:cupin domain-containing protein [Polyangia bacterium]
MPSAVPQHHFSDEILLDYSAGNAKEPLGLPVACHLDLCPDCRIRVHDLESVASASLLTFGFPRASRDVRARLLSELGPKPSPAAPPAIAPELAPLDLPPALHRYLTPAANPRWRLLVPGVREIRLGLGEAEAVGRLVRLRPGVVIPLHDHEGPEYTVVFRGGLDEGDAHFQRGDVCVRDQGIDHEQRVEPGEECVALVINHGGLVPRTLKGHLFKFIAGG